MTFYWILQKKVLEFFGTEKVSGGSLTPGLMWKPSQLQRTLWGPFFSTEAFSKRCLQVSSNFSVLSFFEKRPSTFTQTGWVLKADPKHAPKVLVVFTIPSLSFFGQEKKFLSKHIFFFLKWINVFFPRKVFFFFCKI